MMSVRVESPPPATTPTGPKGSGRARLLAIAAILIASATARGWQDRRVDRPPISPFPLASIPMKLGDWEGHPTTMDPRIVRVSGSADLIARRYVDGRTGTAVDVVVNAGPIIEMLGHIPEVCYPSAGFEPTGTPADRPITPAGGGEPAPFRSLAFAKGEGGLVESQEVYYSLRHDGRWTPSPPGRAALRRNGGMCKIQASRRLGGRERRDIDNPCEPLLALVLAEIEARLSAGGTPPVPAPRIALEAGSRP